MNSINAESASCKLVFSDSYGQAVNGNQAGDVKVIVDNANDTVFMMSGAANNGLKMSNLDLTHQPFQSMMTLKMLILLLIQLEFIQTQLLTEFLFSQALRLRAVFIIFLEEKWVYIILMKLICLHLIMEFI